MAPPPGAALERTTLAWVRTALGCSVVSLLFLHLAGPGVTVALLALGGVAASWSLGLTQWLRHPRRVAALTARTAPTAPPQHTAVLATTATVVALAALALPLVLLGP